MGEASNLSSRFRFLGPHYLIIDPADKTIEHVTAAGSDRPGLDAPLNLPLATAHCQIAIDPHRLFD